MRTRPIFIFLMAGTLLFSACKKQYEGEASARCDGTMHGVSIGNFSTESTKCGGAEGEGALLASDVPLVVGTGDTLFISVYLSDSEGETTNDTKSTPIVSKAHLATEYGEFYTDVYNEDGTQYVSKDEAGNTKTMFKSYVAYSSGWGFDDTYYWPLLTTQNLYFCSYAPLLDVDTYESITNRKWDKTNHIFSFDYKQPVPLTSDQDATVENDILVAVDKQCEEDDKGTVHVNFRHAMVGVKFIKGVINGRIDYIGLDNLFSQGTVNVTTDTLYWKNQSVVRSFSQQFLFDTSKHPADLTPIDSTANEDLTLMMIPQQLPDSAKLSIWMGRALHPEKLSFNDMSSALKDWSKYAGKTLTFRISSSRVNNVKITLNDNVDQETLTKQNIVIKNEGLSPLYIRAVLVGNWLNEDDEILASWNENATNIYGYFNDKSTPAASTFPTVLPTGWVKHSDGFYYYKKYLKSDKVLSQNLFNTFTITSKPKDSEGTWKAPEVEDVNMQISKFEMAILLQAVKADAGFASAKAAWGDEVASFLLNQADVE